MRFISLELKLFKRMKLKNVELFSILITDPVQLILGTNGSGKSSLIGELTPLPANPADYAKDGSKIIKIFHQGKIFILSSLFTGKTAHHFEVEGENLNKGGTAAVQKELVKQYFGITTEIHQLLIGMERFHSMSPSRRREWFTMLSDIDYDYALNVFSKLKERSRDTTGALKLAKKRLVAEVAKVISAEEERKLRSDVEQTQKELNFLIEHRSQVDRPVADYRNERDAGLEELTRLSNRLLRMRFVAPYSRNPDRAMERDEWGELKEPEFNSVAEIEDAINAVKHEITAKETLLNKAIGEHVKLEETIKILQQTGEHGIKELMAERNTLRENKQRLLATRKLHLEGVDATSAMNALDSIGDLLESTLSAIPVNDNKRFSQTRMAEIKTKLLGQKDEKNKHVQEIAFLSNKKTHMEAHKNTSKIDCPKCGHNWSLNYSEQTYQEILTVLGNREEALRLVEAAILVSEKEIEEIQEYAEFYRDFMRCVNNWPALEKFWEYLLDNQLVTHSPRKALSSLDLFRFDLNVELQAKAIDNQIGELDKLIISAEQVGDANLTETKLKLDECTLSIETMTGKLTEKRNRLAQYSQYRRQITEAMELSSKIEALKESVDTSYRNMVEMIRRETLNHCVRHLQIQLVNKEETLSSVTLQKGIVEDLEKQIAALTIEEEAAKALVKHLSPTDGLIAEGLLGFIRNFTGQMNALIRKIWLYPLQVMDCGISNSGGAELDYKFPLMVQTKSNIVQDVSLGSTGMREIIDLAFKVVAMRYLHLSESPLYLDEFASSMDKAHRNQAMGVVKNLMDTQPFTQLFMVSHYESSYGSFTNAQVCVLCPDNITVPGSYNHHVVLQ